MSFRIASIVALTIKHSLRRCAAWPVSRQLLSLYLLLRKLRFLLFSLYLGCFLRRFIQHSPKNFIELALVCFHCFYPRTYMVNILLITHKYTQFPQLYAFDNTTNSSHDGRWREK